MAGVEVPGHHSRRSCAVAGRSPRPAELIGLGSTVVVLVVGFTVLGWFLDSRFHTSPALVFTGLAVGIVTACLVSYSQFRKFLQ
jgi:hypothetical protein